jgi:fucose 4-O-acetylase-like acetyltransferase
LDVGKGIAILAVIIGHIATPLSAFIYLWHIPFFFILSGYTLSTTKPLPSFFWKQTKSLLFPFFLFGVLGICAELLKRRLLPNYTYIHQQLPLSEYFLGLLWEMSIEDLPHYGFVLWFLAALFWAKSITFFLLKHKSSQFQLALVILCFLAGIRWSELPLGLSTGLLGVWWVWIGTRFSQYQAKLVFSRLHALVFFILMLVTTTIASQQFSLNIAYRNVPEPLLTLLISSLFSLSLLIVLKSWQFNISVLSWIGQHSLFLLIVHPYVNNVGYLLTSLLIPQPWYITAFTSVLLNLLLLRAVQYARAILPHYFSRLRHTNPTHCLQSS